MMFTCVPQINQGHDRELHVPMLTERAQKTNSEDQLIRPLKREKQLVRVTNK